MDPTLSFGAVGALFASAAFFVGILVAGITFAWPLRPSWLPWLVSMVLGPAVTFGLAKANGLSFTEAMYYQCLFVGLMAGASAGGYNQMTRKGDELRSEQQKQAYGTVEKPAEAPPVQPENPPPTPPKITMIGKPPEARHGSAGPAVPYRPDPEAEPFTGVNHGIKISYDGPERRVEDSRDTYKGRDRRTRTRSEGGSRGTGPDQEWPE